MRPNPPFDRRASRARRTSDANCRASDREQNSHIAGQARAREASRYARHGSGRDRGFARRCARGQHEERPAKHQTAAERRRRERRPGAASESVRGSARRLHISGARSVGKSDSRGGGGAARRDRGVGDAREEASTPAAQRAARARPVQRSCIEMAAPAAPAPAKGTLRAASEGIAKCRNKDLFKGNLPQSIGKLPWRVANIMPLPPPWLGEDATSSFQTCRGEGGQQGTSARRATSMPRAMCGMWVEQPTLQKF
jgi:hypothetical protein